MSDTTGLALATLSAVALVRYAKRHQVAWLVVASAAVAYATLARWIYGLVAIPFAIYALMVLVESARRWSLQAHPLANTDGARAVPTTGPTAPNPHASPLSSNPVLAPTDPLTFGASEAATQSVETSPATPLVRLPVGSTAPEIASSNASSGPAVRVTRLDTATPAPARSEPTPAAANAAISPRVAMLHAAVALLVAALILVPAVAQPLIGLIRDPAQPATFAGNFQVYSWSPLNALRHDFFTADGHLAYSQPNGVYYTLAPVNFAYFGPLLALWILPGLWAAARGWQLRTIVLVVGWAGIVFAFHAGAPWQNFRFALAYLPPAAILAAAGLLLAWRWFDALHSAQVSASQLLPATNAHSSSSPKDGLTSASLESTAGHRYGRAVLRTLVVACITLGLLTTAAAAVRLVERFIDTKIRLRRPTTTSCAMK
jgi:hypothetical protein